MAFSPTPFSVKVVAKASELYPRACLHAGTSESRGNRHRTDNVRAMNKLAQQRYRYIALTFRATIDLQSLQCVFPHASLPVHKGLNVSVVQQTSCTLSLQVGSCRARQRQNLQNLQTKQSDYTQTVEKLEQVNLSNRDLEVEKQRLEAELSQLNGVQHIRPSAPTTCNGYSDSDSNNSSTGPAVFTTRVGRDIVVEPGHAVKYRKTEQAWFAKVKLMPICECFNAHRQSQIVTTVQKLSLHARSSDLRQVLLAWRLVAVACAISRLLWFFDIRNKGCRASQCAALGCASCLSTALPVQVVACPEPCRPHQSV